MRPDTFQILAVLTRGEQDAAGILDALRDAGADAPTVPTLYRRLKHALDERWLEVLGSAESAGPGRPGHRYRLTPKGLRAVSEEASVWRALSDLVVEPRT